MNPIFSLPYSEFLVAQKLSEIFPAKTGCSVFVPASRQERGIDLIVLHRTPDQAQTATIQVKSSRTYSPKPASRPTRKRRFQYYLWFNRFDVTFDADFWLLVGFYPPADGRTRKSNSSWWAPIILCFSAKEMQDLLDTVKTRDGRPDKMFAFGFDDPAQLFLTRGHQGDEHPNYSAKLLDSRERQDLIAKVLGLSPRT